MIQNVAMEVPLTRLVNYDRGIVYVNWTICVPNHANRRKFVNHRIDLPNDCNSGICDVLYSCGMHIYTLYYFIYILLLYIYIYIYCYILLYNIPPAVSY